MTMINISFPFNVMRSHGLRHPGTVRVRDNRISKGGHTNRHLFCVVNLEAPLFLQIDPQTKTT